MRSRKVHSPILTAIFAVLLALGLLTLGPASDTPLGIPLTVEEARAASSSEKLAELKVRPEGSMTGYSRDRFDHWSNAQDYGWKIPTFVSHAGSCDARDAALIRDGRGEESVGAYCDVNSGVWVDPYGGRTYYDPADIDIDHIVALAEGWRSGASSWTDAKRERFANVRLDVLAVEDNLNASKGDRDPSEWKPPRTAYHCTYARKWINIKHYWKLSVDRAEKSALKQMLGTCR